MIKVVRSYWDCCHSRKVQDLYDTGTCIDAELLPIRKYRILLTQVCQYAGIPNASIWMYRYTAITMAGMYAFRAVANL